MSLRSRARAHLPRVTFRADDSHGFPPGHYYSPIPSAAAIAGHRQRIADVPRSIPGIDADEDGQLALTTQMAAVMGGNGEGPRYRPFNGFFPQGDAVTTQALFRLWRPRRVVEVGSGYSSAAMLDVDDTHLDGDIEFTFIDPYPDRLRSLLTDSDRVRVRVLESPVQEVQRTVFDQLTAGDVLFIDSSHVAKLGSDVLVLFLEIIPSLAAGVHVHVHDIGWPFEYPDEWVSQGWFWSEAYLLRALAIDNPRLRLRWHSAFLTTFHRPTVTSLLPLWAEEPGSSTWWEILGPTPDSN